MLSFWFSSVEFPHADLLMCCLKTLYRTIEVTVQEFIAQQAANSKFQMDKFQINFNYQISMTKTSCKKMQD